MLFNGINLAFIVFVPNNLGRLKSTSRLQFHVVRTARMPGQILVNAFYSMSSTSLFHLFSFPVLVIVNIAFISSEKKLHSRYFTATVRGVFSSWRGLYTGLVTSYIKTSAHNIFKPWEPLSADKTVWTCKGNVHQITWTAAWVCTSFKQFRSCMCCWRKMGRSQELFQQGDPGRSAAWCC